MTKDEARAARLGMGLTQQQLADLLDVRRQTIGEWECGARPITRTNELAIRYLQLSRPGAPKEAKR